MYSVYIIDEDANVRDVIANSIGWEKIGIDGVYTFKNGTEAIEKNNKNPADIIIADLETCGDDLKKTMLDYAKNIDIILLSKSDRYLDIQNALRVGVIDYILKPLDTKKIEQIKNSVTIAYEKLYEENNTQILMHDNTFKGNVSEALNSCDFEFIKETFENIHITQTSVMKNFCLFMLDTLYEYLMSIGVDTAAGENSKKNMLSKFLELKSAEDYKLFVYKIYSNFMQFTQVMPKDESIISRIKHYINEHYKNDDMNITSIARYFQLSNTYLSVLFKQHENINIVTYVINLRMNKSKEILLKTSMNISDVAQSVGFSDPHYFAKSFKKHTGYTPTEYRVQVRKN